MSCGPVIPSDVVATLVYVLGTVIPPQLALVGLVLAGVLWRLFGRAAGRPLLWVCAALLAGWAAVGAHDRSHVALAGPAVALAITLLLDGVATRTRKRLTLAGWLVGPVVGLGVLHAVVEIPVITNEPHVVGASVAQLIDAQIASSIGLLGMALCLGGVALTGARAVVQGERLALWSAFTGIAAIVVEANRATLWEWAYDGSLQGAQHAFALQQYGIATAAGLALWHAGWGRRVRTERPTVAMVAVYALLLATFLGRVNHALVPISDMSIPLLAKPSCPTGATCSQVRRSTTGFPRFSPDLAVIDVRWHAGP